MARVYITVPTVGTIHKLVSVSLLRMFADRCGHTLRIAHPTDIPFENNLSHCVRDFLKGGEDYWLTIDHDNPPISNPLQLVHLDLDVVGCPTPVWHWRGEPGPYPICWNVYRRLEDCYVQYMPQKGLQEVDAVGTGCVLFARRVFEDVEMQKQPFQREWNVDGTVDKGNDLAFCERAKSRGFSIWAHFNYQCRHIVPLDLVEVIRAFSGFMKAR